MARIGVMHTGAMGTTIADALLRAGHDVLSATRDRSELTQARAALVGTREVGTWDRLFEEVDVIFSVAQYGGVIIGERAEWSEEDQMMMTEQGTYPKILSCPTVDAALEVNFEGIFVDCNWIHPSNYEDFRKQASLLNSYVECAIYGYPMSHEQGDWRRFLWLSGNDADVVADLFETDPLMSCKPIVLPDGTQAREFKEDAYENNYMPEGWGELCK